jgi:hypothetical protein
VAEGTGDGSYAEPFPQIVRAYDRCPDKSDCVCDFLDKFRYYWSMCDFGYIFAICSLYLDKIECIFEFCAE